MSNLVPIEELRSRWGRCRELLTIHLPECSGFFVFSRLNIYYFSGSFVSGILWIPLEGDPILLCRRGIERVKIESPCISVYPFSSYRDIEGIFSDHSLTLPRTIAAEMNGLPWSLSKSLTKYMGGHEFINGDRIISMTRAVKSEWEREKLYRAGTSHNHCLTQILPGHLHSGITELQISHRISEIFFAEGHQGIIRMENFGEEAYLGHISIGDSANYPSVFNGPVGLRGVHPAVPYMGSAEISWKAGVPLIIDNGFTFEGYQTDKTQAYWLGNRTTIPSDVQQAHDFCLEMQETVADMLRPGVLPSEIWSICHTMAESSRWLDGFMALDGNKVHFIGHGIGLAVDEYPVLAKGFDHPLEEGMILAVEPKIGIRGLGMVGVENTFEVTPHGGKSLTGGNYDIICI